MKKGQFNDEAAPNLNLGRNVTARNFSDFEKLEELADAGERNNMIAKQGKQQNKG